MYKFYSDKTIKNIINVFGIIIIAMIIFKILFEVNTTDSEPKGIYLLSSAKKIQRNNIVTISTNLNNTTKLAHERNYTSRNRLMKTVMGIPGDTITIINQLVYVNSELIGKIYEKDSQEKPLPSLLKNGTIPPEYYFLASTKNENSFDSRYFGLVPKECIIKKATPFLVGK